MTNHGHQLRVFLPKRSHPAKKWPKRPVFPNTSTGLPCATGNCAQNIHFSCGPLHGWYKTSMAKHQAEGWRQMLVSSFNFQTFNEVLNFKHWKRDELNSVLFPSCVRRRFLFFLRNLLKGRKKCGCVEWRHIHKGPEYQFVIYNGVYTGVSRLIRIRSPANFELNSDKPRIQIYRGPLKANSNFSGTPEHECLE